MAQAQAQASYVAGPPVPLPFASSDFIFISGFSKATALAEVSRKRGNLISS